MMRIRAVYLICLLAGLAASALAQEGHPLTGSWTGDWGTSPTERNSITVVMDWEGENIAGFVLQGVNSIPIASVVLDVTDWTVHLEAKGKDAAGNAVEISTEGQLEDIGSAHRTITGTWRQGTTKGDFRLTRD
jgi:hypothetical protein